MADYLKECMESIDIESSVEEFKEFYCDRCMNEECKHNEWDEQSSEWLRRMKRQEKALNEPEFGDPDHFEEAHAQGFISYTDDDEEGGESFAMDSEWQSWSDEGAEIHKEEPPTQEKPAEKIEENVKSLSDDEEEEGEREEEQENEEKQVQESELEPEPQTQPDQEKEQTVRESETETEEVEENQEQEGRDQKYPDQSGKVLDPDQVDSETSEREKRETKSQPSSDDWSVDEGGSGLTVNISDGEEMDD